MPQRRFSADSNSSKARMIRARRVLGLMPVRGMAPWAIFPWTRTIARTAPFMLRQSWFSSGSLTSAASTSSAWPRLMKSLMPIIIPSSSHTMPRRILPRNAAPLLRIAFAATRFTARPAFMSHEPRPYSFPSSTSPPKGSWRQALRSPSDTTSVCPSSIRHFPGLPESRVAITFSRPGCTSSTSGFTPSSRSIQRATKVTASRSVFPVSGRMTLSMRTRSWVSSTSSCLSMNSNAFFSSSVTAWLLTRLGIEHPAPQLGAGCFLPDESGPDSSGLTLDQDFSTLCLPQNRLMVCSSGLRVRSDTMRNTTSP